MDDETDSSTVDAELTERLEVSVALTKEECVRFVKQVNENCLKLVELLENNGKLLPNKKKRNRKLRAVFGNFEPSIQGTAITRDTNIDEEGHRNRRPRSRRSLLTFSVDRTITRITADCWFSCLRRWYYSRATHIASWSWGLTDTKEVHELRLKDEKVDEIRSDADAHHGMRSTPGSNRTWYELRAQSVLYPQTLILFTFG
ncbi:unnamed protein product [Macrosiphum euphorbiae]|uniref:Uncharacterized protein n=1 Tax=Macrosiphum euphorbiae TaxID=13131 RepID=A0AAV0WLN1_9HEMI|nr:unnamed protein product [Macrosiphum euphorbiae]